MNYHRFLSRIFRASALFLLLTVVTIPMFGADKAEILVAGSHAITFRLSDNGRWAVTSEGLFDLSGSRPEKVSVASGGSVADISDDGETLAGTSGDLPAVLHGRSGKWKKLPVPAGSAAGLINAVTPDGRYAVGLVNPADDIYKARPVMWDLESETMVALENLPSRDMQNLDMGQNYFIDISADGRYITGAMSISYLLPVHLCTYVYDRLSSSYDIVGFTPCDGEPFPDDSDRYGDPIWTPDIPTLHFCEPAKIAPAGTWATGMAYVRHEIPGSWWFNEYYVAQRYNVATGEFEVFDGDDEADIGGYLVIGDGTVLAAQPAVNPYCSCLVRHGNYYYPLTDILAQRYGIDAHRYGIDNSGKPLSVSADGRVIALCTGPETGYILRLPESVADACSGVSLLGSYEVSPASGSAISELRTIKVKFSHSVDVGVAASSKVQLLDSSGELIANAVQTGGVQTDGQTAMFTFRTRRLEEGKSYTIRLLPGCVNVAGDKAMTNPQIDIVYKGRREGAVGLASVNPADGSEVASIDMSQNLVWLTFDADVALATENTEIYLYHDGDSSPVATLRATEASSGARNRIAIYASTDIKLYNGEWFSLEIPAGLVTDLSGQGASEAVTLHYKGAYIPTPQINGNVVFRSDCDNYEGLLFYEGDHRAPKTAVYDMGFTTDDTPWWFVREDNQSTDMALASHSMYTDGGAADDWLTTVPLTVPDATTVLRFDSQSWLYNYNDRLKVIVYPTTSTFYYLTDEIIATIRAEGDVVYDELQDPGSDQEMLSGDWRHNIISLAPYAGRQVYICFVNENRGGSMVIVDNIVVERTVDMSINLSTESYVVGLEAVNIAGTLTMVTPPESDNDIEIVLRDFNDRIVDSLTLPAMKAGEYANFEFSEPLELSVGEPNRFTVEATSGSRSVAVSSIIYDMAFPVERRAVLEVYTGRDCPNCPRAIEMEKRLHSMFGSQFIKIALHTYMSDPRGNGMSAYSRFLQCESVGAPSGRVNRGSITMPMYYSSELNRYVMSRSQLTGEEAEDALLWYDDVAEAVSSPALYDLDVKSVEIDGRNIAADITVSSAININNEEIRVFAVLVEDGVADYQMNGMYGMNDELLGPWGQGGEYGRQYVTDVEADGVARSVWGDYFTGTANMLPRDFTAGDENNVTIEMSIPSTVDDKENCSLVVMLIDGNSGYIVNAISAPLIGASSLLPTTTDEEPEWFDLRGIPVKEPTKGLYLRRTGTLVEKIIL